MNGPSCWMRSWRSRSLSRYFSTVNPGLPRDKRNELFRLLLGLVGETGEIAEKAKKIVRDKNSDFSQWDTEDLKKELGDTLWYVAVIADHFDVPLDDVAQLNLAKLADRQHRAVIGGSGDDR